MALGYRKKPSTYTAHIQPIMSPHAQCKLWMQGAGKYVKFERPSKTCPWVVQHASAFIAYMHCNALQPKQQFKELKAFQASSSKLSNSKIQYEARETLSYVLQFPRAKNRHVFNAFLLAKPFKSVSKIERFSPQQVISSTHIGELPGCTE